MRVLVVEDQPQLSRQLRSALTEAGYVVDAALDGEKADFLGQTEGYDAVILDPPSYGHGPKGEVWKIDTLPVLLELIAELTDGVPEFFLLTCHSPSLGPRELKQLAMDAFGRTLARSMDAAEMTITASDGRELKCGSRIRLGR